MTNFRSLYWDVERDTLIAIPLFVFMGIMLERSKIAEDLLETLREDADIRRLASELEKEVAAGQSSPRVAARRLVETFWTRSR